MQLHKRFTAQKSCQGFTVVEIALVVLVIGLLVAGIVKGRTLIANAERNGTIAQINDIKLAVKSFKDAYQAFPGDMVNATDRLPNCPGAPSTCQNGNGDTIISRPFNGGVQAINPNQNIAGIGFNEATAFWAHLNAADILGGIKPNGVFEFGESLPAAKIGGGFVVGYVTLQNRGIFLTTSAPANGDVIPGHYVTMRTVPSSPEVLGLMTPGEAQIIDQKLDDGMPNTGEVRALRPAPGQCASGTTPAAIYQDNTFATFNDRTCSLTVRFAD